jgi:hypothetical protein
MLEDDIDEDDYEDEFGLPPHSRFPHPPPPGGRGGGIFPPHMEDDMLDEDEEDYMGFG